LRHFDESRRFGDVVDVSGREMEVDGVTQSVDESVDFGGETSARASNTLILGPPFPPAECWWALTYDPSTIDDSWSASSAKR
jgi:hypothetical protein